MSVKISKSDVAMTGLLNCIANAVSNWRPASAKKEITYSAALADYLREICPSDTMVETEYRHAGTTADVWLRWTGFLQKGELFFEVKRNLIKKTDYDRLIGQIEALKPQLNNIIVVLVGETSKELLGRLQDHYKTVLKDGLLIGDEPKMKILTLQVGTE
jgi:hypothetical protein